MSHTWELFLFTQVVKTVARESLLPREGLEDSTLHGGWSMQHQNKVVVMKKVHVRGPHSLWHLNVQSEVSQLLLSPVNSLLLTSTRRYTGWDRDAGNDRTGEPVQKGYHFSKNSRFLLPFPDRNRFALIEKIFFFLPEFKFHARVNTLKKAFLFGPLKGTLNWQGTAVKWWRKLWISVF